MQTAEALHGYMLQYQEEHHKPPTLDEIAAAMETLNYRSSARAAIERAIALGLVETDGDESSSRRYYAVDRQTLDEKFQPTFIVVNTSLWPDD